MNMRRAEIWLCHVAALKKYPGKKPQTVWEEWEDNV